MSYLLGGAGGQAVVHLASYDDVTLSIDIGIAFVFLFRRCFPHFGETLDHYFSFMMGHRRFRHGRAHGGDPFHPALEAGGELDELRPFIGQNPPHNLPAGAAAVAPRSENPPTPGARV